nr:hypothetical protein [Candidatus Sigynarchaeota archaeon]
MAGEDKDLVEIIEEEADQLGLPKEPSVSLFGQPLKLLPGSPEAADIAIFLFLTTIYSPAPVIDTPVHIRGFMENALHLERFIPEISIKELRNGPYYAQFREPATNLTYTFSPEPSLLVVVTGKCLKNTFLTAENFAFALDIYMNDANVPREIALYVDSQYEYGVVAHSDWARVQQIFNVTSKECIEAWRKLIEG